MEPRKTDTILDMEIKINRKGKKKINTRKLLVVTENRTEIKCA